jgi:hypothetical protein
MLDHTHWMAILEQPRQRLDCEGIKAGYYAGG